eukprot:gb/GFBE01061999.1/.p1 GENE.gb/GFBE01061999.1/~~gb/GFBE01061999.1/.p1  ORF type:complete len:207 (+),score=49.47 gb/GFBE01061999.1/:1-621(+)
MPGAVGAIIASRRAGGGRGFRAAPVSASEFKRRQAAHAEYEKKVALKRVIRAYDTNKSGKLERDQVIQLLTDSDSSTPPGTPPSDGQVDFIFKMFDKAGDQAIDANELEELLACWTTYVKHGAEFEETMAKYDVSNTGTLSREEVKAYLTDLNGGVAVTDEELDLVMKEADVLGDGVLNKMELQRATAMWYGYVERKNSTCCCSLQ